jgi:hypothetical protein
MQEKVVFDTSIYVGIFNRGQFTDEIIWFNTITYLVHPVLHELWMGAKGKSEINHLRRFGNTFVKLGRLVQPEPAKSSGSLGSWTRQIQDNTMMFVLPFWHARSAPRWSRGTSMTSKKLSVSLILKSVISYTHSLRNALLLSVVRNAPFGQNYLWWR